MPKRFWLCRCGTRNEKTKRKCAGEGCRRSRPKPRKAPHNKALSDFTYRDYLELNRTIHGVDEVCALCGRDRFSFRAGFKLDRDHDHRTGKPRGLCCVPCNMKLRNVDDLEWLAAAMRYLARAELYEAQQVVA